MGTNLSPIFCSTDYFNNSRVFHNNYRKISHFILRFAWNFCTNRFKFLKQCLTVVDSYTTTGLTKIDTLHV